MNMKTKCLTDAKVLCQFLTLCRGNWHSCIYVRCRHCLKEQPCDSPDFLYLLDDKGLPIILPLADAEIIFPRIPEPEECQSVLTNTQFRDLYWAYLEAEKIPTTDCPRTHFVKRAADMQYKW